MPVVKEYNHGLYVPMAIYDSRKLGASFLRILKAKKNLKVVSDAEVVECGIENNLVTSVKTVKGEAFPCDVLVLS